MDKRIGFESCSTTRRGSCSTTTRRSCSTSKFFPTNPTNLQIQFVIDQGDLMTYKMEESRPRSQEINVNSFNEGLSSSNRTGYLLYLKTARVSMLSRLMIEQGDLLMTQLQHKTTLKYVMKPIRSTLMMKYFVQEWKNPLLFMTRIMNRRW